MPILAVPLNSGRESNLQKAPGHFCSILWIVGLALFTAAMLAVFYELSSDQSISIMVLGVIFFVLMWFAVSSATINMAMKVR